MRSTKFQAPNSKQIPSTKLQLANVLDFGFVVLSLFGICYLRFDFYPSKARAACD